MNCLKGKTTATDRGSRHTRCGPRALLALVIASAVWAEGDPKAAMSIKLPPSDVVDSRTPYRFEISLDEDVTGVPAEFSVEVQSQGSGAAAQEPIRGKLRIPPATAQGPDPSGLLIDASSLADGEYTGKVVVRSGDRAVEKAIAFFRCHYEIGRMGNRDKPVWMLGIFSADNTVVPG